MYDSGSTAFMLVCTMLVLFMTPGLAFFYGGLARRRNVVNTMLMCFGVIGVVGLLWVLAGWSFAYGGDGSLSWFGGFDQLGLVGLVSAMLSEAASVPADAVYPSLVDVCFQMAFAMITAAIVTGSVAGRMRFGAVLAFIGAWSLVVYAPLAHMVWGGEGSLIGDVIGALDFAGGDVVHISSGVTGLILCVALGGRKGFGLKSYRPHNVPFVALGAGLLWLGWFGFNGGSEFAADEVAALAISKLKARFGYDDALDAFGCHGVGGLLGGVLTGLFCVPELSWTGKGGLLYTGDPSLLVSQVLGILVTLAIVVVLDLLLVAALRAVFGDLRVSERDEALGLDVSVHGESAYPAFTGLDS